jgi:hypothetical protein
MALSRLRGATHPIRIAARTVPASADGGRAVCRAVLYLLFVVDFSLYERKINNLR